MRITVIQTNSMHDKARNIAQATDLITRAIETDRPDVLVLPEVWNWRGGTTAVKLAKGAASARTHPQGVDPRRQHDRADPRRQPSL